MDLLEQVEIAIAEARQAVRDEMARAEQEWQDSKKPNLERLKALGLVN